MLQPRFLQMAVAAKWPGNTSRPLLFWSVMPNVPKTKYFCATLNNYAPGDLGVLCFRLQSVCSYYIIGRETGESGTRHLQVYFELLNRIRLNTIKQNLGFPGLHLECRRGSAAQASEYCKKDGDFTEYGTISRSEQGNLTN